jgi:hypothetical protein
MPRVRLEQIAEGMVVTTDVKNMDDMLLIPSGCALTARHITILRTWGIADVQVEGADEDSMATMKLSPEALEKIQKSLRAEFWQFDESSAVQQEIFKLALRNRARAAVSEGANAEFN